MGGLLELMNSRPSWVGSVSKRKKKKRFGLESFLSYRDHPTASLSFIEGRSATRILVLVGKACSLTLLCIWPLGACVSVIPTPQGHQNEF